jgi:hypothetical protein
VLIKKVTILIKQRAIPIANRNIQKYEFMLRKFLNSDVTKGERRAINVPAKVIQSA